MQPAARARDAKRIWLVVAIAVAVAVVVAVVVGTLAMSTWESSLVSRPCCGAGESCLVGSRPCPVPPPPSPTTYIAAGIVYSIAAGLFVYFQFGLSPATSAMMNGSFTTTHGVTVAIMSPADFASFSASPSTFQCPTGSIDCYSTGQVSSGKIDANMPVYWSEQAEGLNVTPYFLVQQNPNTSVATNVTWTTSLVASFVDVYG